MYIITIFTNKYPGCRAIQVVKDEILMLRQYLGKYKTFQCPKACFAAVGELFAI